MKRRKWTALFLAAAMVITTPQSSLAAEFTDSRDAESVIFQDGSEGEDGNESNELPAESEEKTETPTENLNGGTSVIDEEAEVLDSVDVADSNGENIAEEAEEAADIEEDEKLTEDERPEETDENDEEDGEEFEKESATETDGAAGKVGASSSKYGILIDTWQYKNGSYWTITGKVYDGDEDGIGDTLVIRVKGTLAVVYCDNIGISDSEKKKIEKIYIKGAKSIGEKAFHDYTSLTYISIPSTVTEIGNGAFRGCTNLTSVSLPSAVTKIEDYAFYGCSSLRNIKIPSKVTKIGMHAFEYCNNLKSISIPSSVTKIEACTFRECSNLKNVTIFLGLTDIEDQAFYNCTSLESVEIPEGVISLGKSTFYNCTSLKNITLSSGLISIGESAFEGCSNLKEIAIPSSVTSIGMSAFEKCKNLTNVTLPTGITEIQWETFSHCESLTRIEIPAGVSVGTSAFSDCLNLTDLIISDGVVSIGEYAFNRCKSLKNLIIPSSVTSIGKYAFANCLNLTYVEIVYGVISIGEEAFYNSSSLVKISIPSSVEEIGKHVFDIYSGCRTSVLNIYYSGSKTAWSKIDFQGYSLDGDSKIMIYYDSTGTDDTDNTTDAEEEATKSSFTMEAQGGNYAIVGENKLIDITYIAADPENSLSEAKEIVYTVSDPSIAEIENGAGFDIDKTDSAFIVRSFKFKKPGTVTVTGTAPNGKTASVELTAEPKLNVPSEIKLYTKTEIEACSFELEQADAEYLKDFISTVEVEFSSAASDALKISDHYTEVADDGLSGKFIFVIEALKSGTFSYTVTTPGGQEGKVSIYVKNGFLSPSDEWSFGNYAVNSSNPLTEPDQDKLYSGMDASVIRYLCKILAFADGQCYGMAATSLLVSKDALSLDSIQSDISCLNEASETANAQSKIAFYFLNQCTDAVEEEAEKFKNYTVPEQLELIRTSSFPAILSFGCDGWGSHAVVAYAAETGNWSYNGQSYNTRIATYDSNSANNPAKSKYDYYLYFNQGTGQWIIPSYGISSGGNGYLKRIISSVDMISDLSPDAFSSQKVKLNVSDSVFNMQYRLSDSSVVSNCTVTGEKSSVSGEFSAFYTDSDEFSAGGASDLNVWFNTLSSCTISPSGEDTTLDCGILFPNQYLEAEADSYGSATLTETGSVSLEGASGDYSIGITSDEGSSLSGKTVEISGSNSSEITAEMTAQGVVISGDNLKNVVITEQKNNTEVGKVTFDSAQDSVLVSQSEGAIEVKEDSNGDGTYDTTIASGACKHQWSSWETTSKATVFQAEQQKRTCSVCGKTETRSSGSKLKATIKVNAAKVTLQVKQSTTKLKVSGLADGDSVKSWKSSNTKIVKVSKSGKLTAGRKTGKATVTITLASGLKKKITVTVQKKAVKTKKISGLKKSYTLKVGKKQKLSPVLTPFTSTQKITYTSSNKKVAAVSASGTITAKKAGTAKITVKSGSRKYVITVKVKK